MERQRAAFSGGCARANLGATYKRLEGTKMKKKIALVFTVIGVAVAVVPIADAKPFGSGTGGFCICPPPGSVK